MGQFGADLYVLEIDPRSPQAVELDAAALVVADGADVLGAQPQPGARHQGAGHLPAGADNLFLERDLAGVGREARDRQQRVGGVQADAYDIEFGHAKLL